jgi:hypothetical protein
MRVNLLAGLLRPCYRGHVLYLRYKIYVRADFLKAKFSGFLAIDLVTQKLYQFRSITVDERMRTFFCQFNIYGLEYTTSLEKFTCR